MNGAEVFLKKITKNNDTTRNAIVIRENNATVSPTIYIDDMVGTVQEIAAKIVEIYNNAKANMPEFDVSNLNDFISTGDRIVYQLVNASANKELLETLPHRIVNGDLALIYKIWFGYDDVNGCATAKITTQQMDTWGVSEKDLFGVARINTPLIMPSKFCHMAQIMSEQMGIPEEIVKEMMGDVPMYILTNEQHMFGATSIMYSGILDGIANELDSDLAIIPSSIHEVIILPLSDDITDDFVNGMINQVNGDEVTEDEVLGTHIYKYFRR